eukprot:SAG31_NODE_310_length_17887_cov_4.623060_15_plen_75_part_00
MKLILAYCEQVFVRIRRREAALCRMLCIEHEMIGSNSQSPRSDLIELLAPVNDVTTRLLALSGLNVRHHHSVQQ